MDPKEQKIDEIIGRALRDSEFRARLLSEPRAVASSFGLDDEEVQMIADGLSIGDSLLNPQTVAWCTDKTCNEKGGARVTNPGQRVTNPGERVINPNVRKPVKPVAPVRQELVREDEKV